MNNSKKSIDCLNTIRLLAAFQVMYGHTMHHLQIDKVPVLSDIVNFFHGVPIFYALSGYLIWFSISRSDSLRNFYRKRFWRIYPELWVAVIVEIIAILLFYDHPIDWVETIKFTFTQATIFQFWTPDFLRGYGCGCPNGSLWTISIIIQFYFVVWWLYKLLHGKGFVSCAIVTLVTVLIGILSPFLKDYVPLLLMKLYANSFIPYLWLFMIGVLLAEYRKNVLPFLCKYWYIFICCNILIKLTGFDVYALLYSVLGSTTLVLGLIGFAYSFPSLNVKTDVSYGMYIYHMTFVNIFITMGWMHNFTYFVIVALITIFISFISTRTIGALSLKIKNNGNK